MRRAHPTVRSGQVGTALYLGEGSHQGVSLPRASLPEGKDGAGEAGEDAEPQAWPQAVAQGCHLPAQPRQCRPAGEAWTGAAQWGEQEGWGPRGGLAGTHPSIASSTSCLIPLPSNTASCEAPASNTALNPKVASCLAALTWVQGRWGLRRCRRHHGPPVGRWHLRGQCHHRGCAQPAGHLAVSLCRSVAGP